ncbi:protein transport protein bos1 [Dimargaris xerosporica]|nr:protein transport protein bos1 [Dimargaris xerosporica]
MNSAHNAAQKQLFLLRQNLQRLESGQENSLTFQDELQRQLDEFNRKIQAYRVLSQKELVVQRKQQAKERIRQFTDDYNATAQALQRVRLKEQERQAQAASRQELLQRHPTEHEPQAEATSIEMDYVHREQQSLQYSENAIDGFIDTAQAALANLREQGGWLKNSRRRLLDTANTLGLSRSVIHYIERRTSQDKWIFWGAVVFTIVFIWVLIHYFR